MSLPIPTTEKITTCKNFSHPIRESASGKADRWVYSQPDSKS